MCACSAGCCSGLTVQEAFKCNGTIVKIDSCNINGRQKIRVYLIREGGNGVFGELATLTSDDVNVDVNKEYQEGDTVALHVNQDVDTE